MHIAILGTRGIPANYGGFETFAEELSVRLVARGHEVTVYGRSNYIKTKERIYKGVRLVVLPTIKQKYLDTPVNTFLATLHALFKKYDILFYCNSANSFCTLLPRIVGKRVVLNVDGMEWKRAKWSWFGKSIYRISEFLATFSPDQVVTDAREVQLYYKRKFNKESILIPYGATVGRVESYDALKRFGIKKGQYVLYVSRLEPENNAHVVVKAFEKVKTDFKLVIVGDAPYSKNYIKQLKSTNDPRIVFTGYIFGKGYREFQSHAYCYVQATEVGGTHPALVEAMAHGNCILANDVPEHREVLGDAGIYFKHNDPCDLSAKLQYFLDHPGEVEKYRVKAEARVREKYTWEKVTSDYERLFLKFV
ncbi:MAG: glycosyl transferase family 1 [Candidatus Neomarinimicrobiota bacterium]|nr:MAG: glycosyl transferase family 1 [Candidatus Neomarinimicrobiota bacterium]